MRVSGSSPLMLRTFPGMARHMVLFQVEIVSRRKNLSERDAAVIRRHALMPVWLEFFRAQPRHGAFSEVTVLKTAAAQSYACQSRYFSDGDHCLGQRVVEFRGNFRHGNAPIHI